VNIGNDTIERLVLEARRAAEKAYAPYSNLRVGAALINEDGKIFTGVNVENASFGLTVCAERNAIFSSVSNANRTIEALVIYTPTQTPTAPCGACRQVIKEFSQDALIVSVCDSDNRLVRTIAELLPSSFGPESLT